MRMVMVRNSVLKFANDIVPQDRHTFMLPTVAIVPVLPNLCLALGWRYLDESFLEAARDHHWLFSMVESIDREISLARDEYAVSTGEFGLIRSLDGLGNVVYAEMTPEIQALEALDRVDTPRTDSFHSIQLRHHIAGRGSVRPLPVFPEAAQLLAYAEAERERFPSVLAYVKIFERAFSESENKLVVSLEKFFKHSQVIYSKDEIRKWLNLRGEDSHAIKRVASFDNPKYDVTFFRLRQAAIDVAYNKRNWADKRALRENRVPLGAWYNLDGSIAATKGYEVEFAFRRDLLGGRLILPPTPRETETLLKRSVAAFSKLKLLDQSDRFCGVAVFGKGDKVRVTPEEQMKFSPTGYLWIFE